MNQPFDFAYIDEQRVLDEFNRNDQLLVSIENDLVSLEHYQQLIDDNLIRSHHVKELQDITARYKSFSPSLESYSVSLERQNLAGDIISSVMIGTLVSGAVMFITTVIRYIVGLFQNKGNSNNMANGPAITITHSGKVANDPINSELQTQLDRVNDYLGYGNLGQMLVAKFATILPDFNRDPKATYEAGQFKDDYETWVKAMKAYSVYYNILNQWRLFTGISRDGATTDRSLNGLVKTVQTLMSDNWFPKIVFVNIEKEDSLFKKVPEAIISHNGFDANMKLIEGNLFELIKLDQQINAFMSQPDEYETILNKIKGYKGLANIQKEQADMIYENVSKIALVSNALVWFKTVDDGYLKKYNACVEFNKNRLSENLEKVSRNITKNNGKDYANSVERFFEKCRQRDPESEENAAKWNELTKEFGKMIPTTVSRFMRAYLQYAKMYIIMGRIMRSWNKFTDGLDKEVKKLKEI